MFETQKMRDQQKSQIYSDSLMMTDSQQVHQSHFSKTTGGGTTRPISETAATYGEVKELNLLRLTDLIKMLRQQAHQLNSKDILGQMDLVL